MGPLGAQTLQIQALELGFKTLEIGGFLLNFAKNPHIFRI
jgi:hypothetical protein